MGEGNADIGVDIDSHGWGATRSWVEKELSAAERIEGVERLRGGWTSEMRCLDLRGPDGRRSLVLRSFVKPFFVRHAEGLLNREAAVLRLLGDTDVPAATFVAADATAQYCDHPSLLMSLLPGTVRLSDQGADDRVELLARQLVCIHRLPVSTQQRPRTYQAWASPERVTLPAATERPELWQRAVEVIRREPPAHQGCFLHRDFHPGNVLFTGTGDDLRISGVVDWVETSWGLPIWTWLTVRRLSPCCTGFPRACASPIGTSLREEPWPKTAPPVSTGGCWTRWVSLRTRRRSLFPGVNWAASI